MSLKSQIENDIKEAMKAKKKEDLLALRAIKSAILMAQTEKGGSDELSEEAEMKLLMKQAKQRKESAETFRKENRPELAEKEEAELAVIERYLPAMMGPEELKAEVAAVIAEVGATSLADMGKVMGRATQKLAGRADGKDISTEVKAQLG